MKIFIKNGSSTSELCLWVCFPSLGMQKPSLPVPLRPHSGSGASPSKLLGMCTSPRLDLTCHVKALLPPPILNTCLRRKPRPCHHPPCPVSFICTASSSICGPPTPSLLLTTCDPTGQRRQRVSLGPSPSCQDPDITQ